LATSTDLVANIFTEGIILFILIYYNPVHMCIHVHDVYKE